MTFLAAYIANLAGAAPVEDQKSTLTGATGAGGIFSALVDATGAAQASEGDAAPILPPFELPAAPATQAQTTPASTESSALREVLTQGLGFPSDGAEIDAVILDNPQPGNITPVDSFLPAAVPDTEVQPQPPEDGQPLNLDLRLVPVETPVPAPAAPQSDAPIQNAALSPPAQPLVEISDQPAQPQPITQQASAGAQAPVRDVQSQASQEAVADKTTQNTQERGLQIAFRQPGEAKGSQAEGQPTQATHTTKQTDDAQPAVRNTGQRQAAGIPASDKQGDTRAQFAEHGPQIIKTAVKAGSGQTLIRFQKFSVGDPAIATSPPTLTVNVPANTASPGPASANTPHVPVSALAVHIATQANNGARRFEIRLDPPELGRIEVRLNISREGQVMTHLVVERPETLDLLQRDARQLERALQDAGLNTSKENMEFSLKDQSLARGGKDQAEGDEDFASLTDSDDNDPPDIPDDSMPPPIRYMATTGLDIHI